MIWCMQCPGSAWIYTCIQFTNNKTTYLKVENSTNGTAHFGKCKQLFEFQLLLSLVVKIWIYTIMLFIFPTSVLIRHLWQLKTLVSLHWCPICVVPLVYWSCPLPEYHNRYSLELKYKKTLRLFQCPVFFYKISLCKVS